MDNIQSQHSQDRVKPSSIEDVSALPEALAGQNQLMTQYDMIQQLGKGSQGEVWLAKRKSDGEKVAIKQLNVHSVTSWKDYELFRREAEILSNLKVDGVVPLYAYIEDLKSSPACVCIIQKYIEGETLASYMNRKYRFETETIYDLLMQVVIILQKIHTRKPPVIHRDIKPSNLMLTPQKNGKFRVTLLDFGAVANPQVQNGGSTVAGTFGYMPPEQLMGQAVPASDIYALGGVAVQLLSGVSPADIEVCDFKLVIEPYLGHVKPEVVKTLHAMLEPAVSNRICDYNALIAQFKALANKQAPTLLNFFKEAQVIKLEDVVSICQRGNYELWQNLDFEKDFYKVKALLPKQMAGAEQGQYGDIDALQQFNSLVYGRRASLILYIAGVVFLFFPIYGVLMVLLGGILDLILGMYVGYVMVPLFFIFPFLYIVGAVIIYKKVYYPKCEKNRILKLSSGAESVQQFGHSLKSVTTFSGLMGQDSTSSYCSAVSPTMAPTFSSMIDLSLFASFFKDGQKAIGKIMKIEYLPIAASKVKSDQYANQSIFFANSLPRFRVTYQYRLPKGCIERAGIDVTDSFLYQCDLYGEMIVTSSPETYYKVGDLVPILLKLNKKMWAKDIFDVRTMPYPYPYAILTDTSDVIFDLTMPSALLKVKDVRMVDQFIQTYQPMGIDQQKMGKKTADMKLIELFDLWGFKNLYRIKVNYFKNKSDSANVIQSYQEAIQKGEFSALIDLGKYYQSIQSYKKAISCFEEAFHKGEKTLYRDIIECYKELCDYESILKWLDIATQAFEYSVKHENVPVPHQIEFCKSIVGYCFELEDWQHAGQWATRAYELGHQAAAFTIADIYRNMENHQAAAEWYLKEKCTSKAQALDIANYLLSSKDYGHARVLFEAALEYIPKDTREYLEIENKIIVLKTHRG